MSLISGGFCAQKSLLEGTEEKVRRDLDLMCDRGAEWLRIDIAWSAIEPTTKGTYKWANTDKVITAARKRGLKLVHLVTSTPVWATPGGTGTWSTPPDGTINYADFCTAFAQRYAPFGGDVIECWNEPNLNIFWDTGPDPVAYTALLKAGYNAIKAVNASIPVLFAGLAGGPTSTSMLTMRDFISQSYTAGAKPYFDAMNIHPYGYPHYPTTAHADNYFDDIPTIYADMTAQGDGAKKLWITEYGAPTAGGTRAVTEAQQAEIAAEAVATAAGYSYCGPLFWYNFENKGTNATYEHNFGAMTTDGREKPVMAALAKAWGRPRVTSRTR